MASQIDYTKLAQTDLPETELFARTTTRLRQIEPFVHVHRMNYTSYVRGSIWVKQQRLKQNNPNGPHFNNIVKEQERKNHHLRLLLKETMPYMSEYNHLMHMIAKYTEDAELQKYENLNV